MHSPSTITTCSFNSYVLLKFLEQIRSQAPIKENFLQLPSGYNLNTTSLCNSRCIIPLHNHIYFLQEPLDAINSKIKKWSFQVQTKSHLSPCVNNPMLPEGWLSFLNSLRDINNNNHHNSWGSYSNSGCFFPCNIPGSVLSCTFTCLK